MGPREGRGRGKGPAPEDRQRDTLQDPVLFQLPVHQQALCAGVPGLGNGYRRPGKCERELRAAWRLLGRKGRERFTAPCGVPQAGSFRVIPAVHGVHSWPLNPQCRSHQMWAPSLSAGGEPRLWVPATGDMGALVEESQGTCHSIHYMPFSQPLRLR